MNIKTVSCVVVLLAIMQGGPNLNAQQAGFVVGIAPPSLPAQQPQMQVPRPTPPPQHQVRPAFQGSLQPFVVAPVQAFGFGTPVTTFGFGVTPHMVPPIITTSYSPIFNQFQQTTMPFAGPGVAANGITLIVPAGTVFANSTVIYQQPSALGFNIAPRVMQQQQQQQQPPQTVPPRPPPPAVGTPRTQLLQEFGTPSASIITQEGETLFYTGGVQILIRDGKVARPD